MGLSKRLLGATTCFVGAAVGGKLAHDQLSGRTAKQVSPIPLMTGIAGGVAAVGALAGVRMLAGRRSMIAAPALLAGAALGATWNVLPAPVIWPFGVIAGGALEGVNIASALVPLPVHPHLQGSWLHEGDVFEPTRPGEGLGAGIIDHAARFVGLLDDPADQSTLRDHRTVLATTTAAGTATPGDVTIATFNATAPGNSWQVAGHESAMVSIYVDGKHSSDVTVLQENTGSWKVNLGHLPAGEHHIEVRDARDQASPDSAPVSVTNLATQTLTGASAEIAAHAPTLEGRSITMHSGRQDQSRNDTPLAMTASVNPGPDGVDTISYRMFFSGEDGGHSVPALYLGGGRSLDEETAYVVRVDRQSGKVLAEQYEGPGHEFHDFAGEHVEGRAELRNATANNNFSDRLRGLAPVWSPVPELANPGTRQLDVPIAHPWMFEVMAKELRREGSVAARPDDLHIADPNRYLYLPAVDDLLTRVEQEQPFHVRLHDGSVVQVTASEGRGDRGGQGTEVLLPEGVRGSDVASLVDVRGEAWVLDDNDQLTRVGEPPA